MLVPLVRPLTRLWGTSSNAVSVGSREHPQQQIMWLKFLDVSFNLYMVKTWALCLLAGELSNFQIYFRIN